MKFTSNIKLLTLGLSIGLSACGAPSGLEPTDLDSVEAQVGAATSSELSVSERGNQFLVDLGGAAALELFETMRRADGFSISERRGVTVYYGTFMACASNRREAFCQMLSPRVGEAEGFELTIHGGRFSSSSGELFGALARASGISPASVSEVTGDHFFCAKSSSEAWCGLLPMSAAPETKTLELAMRYVGLPNLGDDYVYEGWLITTEGPVSSGRFEITRDDQTLSFDVDESVAADSDLFVLTIEPRVGDDPAPAATHILAGGFNGSVASLALGHVAALGDDLTGAAGGYILGVPTDPEAPSYDQGIWFLDPSAGPGPSLELASLPEGWVYEGWVVGANGPVSTGRFTSLEGSDADGAGPAAGPMGSPPFPGQDFVSPPMNLIGSTVVISVEPEPDNSPAPFALKPLVGEAKDLGAGMLQTLANNADATNPLGIAAFFDDKGELYAR